MTKMCVPFWVRCRRYTLSVLWRRIRQPFRRHAHYKRAVALSVPFLVTATPRKRNFKSVLAVGDFSQITGLSRAFRAELQILAKEYANCDFRVQCLSLLPENVPRLNAPDHLILLTQPDTYQHIFQLFEPSDLRDTYRTGFAVWEMQNFPRHWKPYLDCVHQIYTPSNFSAIALRKERPDSVVVRPHQLLSCSVELPDSVKREDFNISETDFLGMAVMDLRTCPDRKNPHGTILAWQKAFGNQSDKVLLLKCHFSRHTEVIRKEIQDLIAGYSNIRLLERHFSDIEMRSFQSLADVYISLHRSEGYGLNIAEMLALNKPTVVTDWSGNIDFTRGHPLAYSVPTRIIPYRDYLGTYRGTARCGLYWAEPDLDRAVSYLRDIADKSSCSTSHASCALPHLIMV